MNIYTNLIAEDLGKIGIGIGDTFTIHHREQSHSIAFAKAISDVPYGEWVAFIDPESQVQISRNYANAAETLAAKGGDPLLLSNQPD